jgi:hypothetical protein
MASNRKSHFTKSLTDTVKENILLYRMELTKEKFLHAKNNRIIKNVLLQRS